MLPTAAVCKNKSNETNSPRTAWGCVVGVRFNWKLQGEYNTRTLQAHRLSCRTLPKVVFLLAGSLQRAYVWARWTHTMLVLYYPRAWAMVSSSNSLFHSLHCLPTEQQIKSRILNNWKPKSKIFKVLFIVFSLKLTIMVWRPDELRSKRETKYQTTELFFMEKKGS